MNQLKAITFDLDDTLFDRTEAQRRTLRLIMQEHVGSILMGSNHQRKI